VCLREPRDLDALAADTPGHQQRLVVVAIIDAQAGKGIGGRHREQFAGARDQWILRLGAMPLSCAWASAITCAQLIVTLLRS
jgi:hypothetical protein